MARSRRGAVELPVLLGTIALSLLIAGLSVIGIRMLSGAQEYHDMGGYYPPMDGGSYGGYMAPVTAPTTTTPTTTTTTTTEPVAPTKVVTPESAMEQEVEMHMELLRNAASTNCVDARLANTPEGMHFRETAKSSVSAILREKWLSVHGEEKLQSLINEGIICPSLEELAAEGATFQTADCADANRTAFERTKVAQLKYKESGKEEDLVTWKTLFETSLYNNPKTPAGCNPDPDLFLYEGLNQTCYSHDDCGPGYCKAVEQDSLSRADRLAASLLGREGPEGMCTPLASTQCVTDADCAEGKTCLYPSKPCLDAASCALDTGSCTLVAHPVAEEQEEEGTQEGPAVTACGPSLSEVKEWLAENGVEASPGEILEEHERILNEEYDATRAQQEACLIEGATTDESTEEGGGDAVIASAEAGPALAGAVATFVPLSVDPNLPADIQEKAQFALTEVSRLLDVLSTGESLEPQSIIAIVQLIEEVRDELPEEYVREHAGANWEKKATGASMEVRGELGNVQAMLDWIGLFLEKLEENQDDLELSSADLKDWKEYHAEANTVFYEEILPLCQGAIASIEGGQMSDALRGCFEDIQGRVFGVLERTMKPAMERFMASGNETLMTIMMAIGMPPDMGQDDMHGGGEYQGGMDCERQCEMRMPGVTEVIAWADSQVASQDESCLNEEVETDSCEALFDQYDRQGYAQAFGPQGMQIMEAVHACYDSCRGGMEGPGFDRGRQQEMQNYVNDVLTGAADTCCAMNQPGWECVMSQAPRDIFDLGVHPNVPLPGIDMECQQQGGDCRDLWPQIDAQLDGVYGWERHEMWKDLVKSTFEAAGFPECIPEEVYEETTHPGMPGMPGGMPGMPGGMPGMMPWTPGGGDQASCEARRGDDCKRMCAQFPGNANCVTQCMSGPSPCGYMGGGNMQPGMPGGMHPGYQDTMSCDQKCSTPGASPEQKASCIEMCQRPQPGIGGMPGGMPNQGYSLEQCTRDKAACVDACGTDTVCMSRCPMCPIEGGMMPGTSGGMYGSPGTGMSCEQGCDMMTNSTPEQKAMCKSNCTGMYQGSSMPSGTSSSYSSMPSGSTSSYSSMPSGSTSSYSSMPSGSTSSASSYSQPTYSSPPPDSTYTAPPPSEPPPPQ